jgi:hypothetical protein
MPSELSLSLVLHVHYCSSVTSMSNGDICKALPGGGSVVAPLPDFAVVSAVPGGVDLGFVLLGAHAVPPRRRVKNSRT